MMTNRYATHEIQLGMQTLKEFLDDLKPLDVLPDPKPPSMEPETYMCAANMAALMVTYDDGRYVCDIGFRKAPAGHPQLLGIVGAPGSGFSTTREIGKLKRPGFTGEFFVQNLCDVIKGVHACIECVLHFLRGPMADCAM